MQNAVLVSPSLSGRYALPFLMLSHHQLHGFVPIAPPTQNYTQEQFQAVKVLGGGSLVLASCPWLGSWGEKDIGCTWKTHGPILDLDLEEMVYGRYPKEVA